MSLRWGVSIKSLVSDSRGVLVLDSEDEARRNLIHPDDRLVVDDGNGWMVTE